MCRKLVSCVDFKAILTPFSEVIWRQNGFKIGTRDKFAITWNSWSRYLYLIDRVQRGVNKHPRGKDKVDTGFQARITPLSYSNPLLT